MMESAQTIDANSRREVKCDVMTTAEEMRVEDCRKCGYSDRNHLRPPVQFKAIEHNRLRKLESDARKCRRSSLVATK